MRNSKSEANNAAETNSIDDAAQFLTGDLSDRHLNEAEMNAIVGGGSLRVGGGTVQARSSTTLECWDNCTVRISGCKKKLTT